MPRPKTGQGKTLYIPQDKLEAVQAILDDESNPTSKTNLEDAISSILRTIPPNKRSWAGRLFNRLKGAIDGVNSRG
ncbi:MAG: hypothetical protein KME13_24195 [Myxacorys californica WJT36-NPBG1]|nr:hypothetical protein [Myxacorys californica WJT36-NPBG1]